MSLGLGLGLGLHTGRWNDGRVLDLDLVHSRGPAPLGTYARSTPAMQFDSSGVLGWGAHNLLLRSQEFDNASWTKTRVLAFGAGSTADATVAPDGTTTADLIVEDTSTNTHLVNQTITSNTGPTTLSVYAKAAGRNLTIDLSDNTTGNALCAFDLSAGTAGTPNATGSWSGTVASIASVGNGWYRCSVSSTRGAGTQTVCNLGLRNASSSSYAGDGTSGIYLWGAQLNYGTTALTYVPTTSAAVTNQPRPDYDPATLVKRGWLMEGSRQNLLTYSEDFSTTWTRTRIQAFGSGSVVNATTAPDGTSTADKIAEIDDAATSTTHYISQNIAKAASAIAYSASVYAKAAERTRVQLRMADVGDVGAAYCVFDLAGGQIGVAVTTSGATAFTSASASIVSAGNGWYRCTVNATSNTEATIGVRAYLDSGTGTGANSPSYDGDGTSGIYLWGAQLEAATFPSSYIPTTTTSFSRSADLWTISNAQFLAATGQNIPQAEGTMFVEYSYDGSIATTSGSRFPACIDDGTSTTRIAVAHDAGSVYALCANAAAGGTQSYMSLGALATRTVSKVAWAWKANDAAACKDGGTVQADATMATPTTTTLCIGGSSNGGGNNQLHGWLRRVIIYPTRLTNAQLQRMTA